MITWRQKCRYCFFFKQNAANGYSEEKMKVIVKNKNVCYGYLETKIQGMVIGGQKTLLRFISKECSFNQLKTPIQGIKRKDVRWLVGFYGKSTFVGYLMPNQFLYK